MKPISSEEREKIYKLHKIYSSDMPDFIKELVETKEMQRIKLVGQNCGRDYISESMQEFKYNYSRLDHSIGVGLIVWHFTKDAKQSISALFHDIATPTFSHVIDYYNNDEARQTSTEKGTTRIIRNSLEINKILEKYDIKVEDVLDYSRYPIADNNTPKLSADRLEYNAYMGTTRGLISFDEMLQIYNDIIIVKNEDNVDEMCFQNLELAKKMTKVALENGEYMSGGISTITNKLLSDILKIAVLRGIITPRMFYECNEEELIEILENAEENNIKQLWNKFKKFDKICTSKRETLRGYSVQSKAKKRYIDPLVIVNGKIARITNIDPILRRKINNFIEPEDLYFEI